MVYLYGKDGILGFTYNGTEYYYGKNLFGDISDIYDATGTKVAHYVYDAWGNHDVYDGQGNAKTDSAFIGNINPFRYRGYYFDTETGFYYLHSRYYDPVAGRFLNADSLAYLGVDGELRGYNLYAYCGNNPLHNTFLKTSDSTNAQRQLFRNDAEDFFSQIFGFSINYTKEIPNFSKYYIFFQVETGVGYSKSFSNGKPVNFYLSSPENPWEFWKISYGVDININGYGIGIGRGSEASLTFHLGKNSLDLHINLLGRVGFKWSTEGTNGEYHYSKFEFNVPEILVGAAILYFAWPYILQLLGTLKSVPKAIPGLT